MNTPVHQIVVTQEHIPAHIALHDPSVASGFNTVPHWHETLELICSLDSKLDIRCDKKHFILDKHDVAIINRNQIHTVVPLTGFTHYGISITFGPEFEKKYCESSKYSYFELSGNEDKRKELISYIEKLNNISRSSESVPYQNLVINSLLFQISFILLTYFQRSNLALEGNKSKLSTLKYRTRFQEIMSYIQEHYAEPLTLDDLSAFAGLSKEHLSREFKKYIGEGFREHLARIRMTHAQSDLENTDIPLLELAIRHGFTDLRSYNHAFHKQYGMNPAQYRRRVKYQNSNPKTK